MRLVSFSPPLPFGAWWRFPIERGVLADTTITVSETAAVSFSLILTSIASLSSPWSEGECLWWLDSTKGAETRKSGDGFVQRFESHTVCLKGYNIQN